MQNHQIVGEAYNQSLLLSITIDHRPRHTAEQRRFPNAIASHEAVMSAFVETQRGRSQKLFAIDRYIHTFQINVSISA